MKNGRLVQGCGFAIMTSAVFLLSQGCKSTGGAESGVLETAGESAGAAMTFDGTVYTRSCGSFSNLSGDFQMHYRPADGAIPAAVTATITYAGKDAGSRIDRQEPQELALEQDGSGAWSGAFTKVLNSRGSSRFLDTVQLQTKVVFDDGTTSQDPQFYTVAMPEAGKAPCVNAGEAPSALVAMTVLRETSGLSGDHTGNVGAGNGDAAIAGAPLVRGSICAHPTYVGGDFAVGYQSQDSQAISGVTLVYGFTGKDGNNGLDWVDRTELPLTFDAAQGWHGKFDKRLTGTGSPKSLTALQFALKVSLQNGSTNWVKGGDSAQGFYQADFPAFGDSSQCAASGSKASAWPTLGVRAVERK